MNEKLPPIPAAEASESQPPLEYELLTGHQRTDGSFKTSEQLRSEYVHRTDKLIYEMTNGVPVVDPVTGEKRTEKPDYVVWLDKSARPVAWLAKELWPKLAPEPGQPAPTMPEFRFANIDREQWRNAVDPMGMGKMDIKLVHASVIRSLRSIFISPENKRGGLNESIDAAPTELDDKTVLIVDEVHSTGKTLDIAKQLFERAFPTARIAGSYWMGGIVQKGLAVGNADLPVWYKEKDKTGRGIDNRNDIKSQRSHSMTQRLGAMFLSTVFETPDPSSVQLRHELTQLAHDPDVLIVPSLQRDDFVERITALNNMTLEEFRAAKAKLDSGK